MVECKEGHYCSSQGLADVSGECEAGSYSYHLIWASRVLWLSPYLGITCIMDITVFGHHMIYGGVQGGALLLLSESS